MNAGGMDRVITLQRVTLEDDGYGMVETWSDQATVKAEVRQQGGKEFFAAAQVQAEMRVVFYIRWLDGLTVVDRVQYEDRLHNIVEIREIKRRGGLELHTIAAA